MSFYFQPFGHVYKNKIYMNSVHMVKSTKNTQNGNYKFLPAQEEWNQLPHDSQKTHKFALLWLHSSATQRDPTKGTAIKVNVYNTVL